MLFANRELTCNPLVARLFGGYFSVVNQFEISITVERGTANCHGRYLCYEGEINGYRIHARVMQHPSARGIAKGRIVQFYVSKTGLFGIRDCELFYNLRWDSPPPTGQIRSVVEQAVKQIDSKSVDWDEERKRYEASWRD